MNKSEIQNLTRIETVEVILQSVKITLIPAGVMLFCGVLTVLCPNPPSKPVAHAIQHLAAGILLSAIALELIPTIAAAEDDASILGLVVGFSMGSIVMIALPLLLDEADEGEGSSRKVSPPIEMQDVVIEAENVSTQNDTHSLSSFGCYPTSTSDLPGCENISVQESKSTNFVKRLFLRRAHALRQRFGLKISRAGPLAASADRDDAVVNEPRANSLDCCKEKKSIEAFPATFAAAVFIDSAMDGLLVGISLITGESAGVFMAVAMASEMGFLGVSFAVAVASRPRWQSLPAAAGGPICMLLGAVVGGAAAHALAVNEPLLVGCTAFGVAALLYMVTEELLVSAHEDGFGHRWWVDIQVFVGFLLALVAGKLLARHG